MDSNWSRLIDELRRSVLGEIYLYVCITSPLLSMRVCCIADSYFDTSEGGGEPCRTRMIFVRPGGLDWR
jgi:hypothetical protein